MKNDRALRKRQQLENIVGLLRIVPRLAQMNQGSSAGSENRNEHKHDSERGQDDEEKGQTNTKTPIIVDFCSGSGHLGFLIAKTMPHCMVYLVEINTTAAETARRRKAESKMDNIVVFNCGIEDFNERQVEDVDDDKCRV